MISMQKFQDDNYKIEYYTEKAILFIRDPFKVYMQDLALNNVDKEGQQSILLVLSCIEIMIGIKLYKVVMESETTIYFFTKSLEKVNKL